MKLTAATLFLSLLTSSLSFTWAKTEEGVPSDKVAPVDTTLDSILQGNHTADSPVDSDIALQSSNNTAFLTNEEEKDRVTTDKDEKAKKNDDTTTTTTTDNSDSTNSTPAPVNNNDSDETVEVKLQEKPQYDTQQQQDSAKEGAGDSGNAAPTAVDGNDEPTTLEEPSVEHADEATSKSSQHKDIKDAQATKETTKAVDTEPESAPESLTDGVSSTVSTADMDLVDESSEVLASSDMPSDVPTSAPVSASSGSLMPSIIAGGNDLFGWWQEQPSSSQFARIIMSSHVLLEVVE
jgi:hypothetical protein